MKTIFKKTTVLIFLLLTASFYNANAQKTNDAPKYNSVFWEISGNDLEKPSYLLGTLHLIPKAEYNFSDLMLEKFNSCESLVIEADINAPLKEQIALLKKIMLPEGKSIDAFMTAEQYTNFQSLMLDSLKIKESTFNKIIKFKPIFSSSLVFAELIEKPTAFEKELSKLAKKKKKEIQTLETLDFQINILEALTLEEQIEMILDEEYSNPLKEYNKLLDIYKNQDLDSLLNLTLSEPSMNKLMNKLLYDRNADWIPKIENIIKEQPAFIAVGAAHLPGEQGVISLLRKQGYTVKPVK